MRNLGHGPLPHSIFMARDPIRLKLRCVDGVRPWARSQMGETRIVDTYLFASRGMLMVKLPAKSTVADEIRLGDEVELTAGSDVTLSMTHVAVEIALPLTGPPCDILLGLRPLASGPDLHEIGRLIASNPTERIVLRWGVQPIE